MVLGLKLNSDANSVSYSPNGTQLIAAGTDNYIIVGNTANREELPKIEERVWRVVFTPDDIIDTHTVTNHNKFVSLAIA